MRIPRAASLFGIGLAAALTSTPTLAQQRTNAGLGTPKRGFDASARTPGGNVRLTGVACIGGKTYVSSDAVGQTPMTYEFDSTGKLTRQFQTPVGVGTNDLANDGKSILAASPSGIWVFDTSGKLVNQVVAKNGPQKIVQPIAGAALGRLTAFRGLAYDAAGNGGKGSFFVGNTGTTREILEIDTTGKILRSFRNKGWDCSGLARDPRSGNLWCLNGAGGTNVIELDVNKSLQPTGVFFPERWSDTTFRGGLDGIPGGDKGSYPSDFDLAVLTRLNGPDWVFYHRVHLHPGLLGQNHAFLEASVNSTKLTRGNLGDLGKIKVNDTLRWRINPGRSKSKASPAAIVINAGPDAAKDGVTGFLRELRVLNPASTPPSSALLIAATSVGTQMSAKLPHGLRCFELLRMQGIYIEVGPPATLIATNEVFTNVFDEKSCFIVVESVGGNSFNAITTSGFWRVIHKGGPGIKDITFDWTETRDPRQFNIRFDTNNPNMADFFDAGNSTRAGCKGTYRNNSHVKTGLVFDKLNHAPNPCNTSANTGWIGTNMYGTTANDYRTLKFRFTKFVGTPSKPLVFEFDCDTDGGIGTDGSSMAGCVVTVTLTNNVVWKSELRPDPAKAQRSVAGF